jgi:hypothetical protein
MSAVLRIVLVALVLTGIPAAAFSSDRDRGSPRPSCVPEWAAAGTCSYVHRKLVRGTRYCAWHLATVQSLVGLAFGAAAPTAVRPATM